MIDFLIKLLKKTRCYYLKPNENTKSKKIDSYIEPS